MIPRVCSVMPASIFSGFMEKWSADAPVQVNSLVLTGNALLAAGPPDVVDETAVVKALGLPETATKLARQEAALQGREGGLLIAVSPTSGEKLAAYKLDSMPRFDGMIAAGEWREHYTFDEWRCHRSYRQLYANARRR